MNEGNFFSRHLGKIFKREDQDYQPVQDRTVDVFAHRAGSRNTDLDKSPSLIQQIKEAKTKQNHWEQNSIENAQDAFGTVNGAEIDITFTQDGVCVVTHDDVSKLTFEEFKEKHPDHATLESWINWLNQPGMEDKKLYLDLKGTDQDPFKMVEMIEQLGDRVEVGSKDPSTVIRLLLARRLLNTQCKIHLQIPDPIHGAIAVRYAQRIVDITGMDREALIKQGIDPEKDLKPDGLHFYWPEDVVKDIVSEMVKHGQFAPVSDQSIPVDDKSFSRWKGAPIFNSLGKFIQKRRLRGFVRRAKQAGYDVVAGSTGSPQVMEEMIQWGVDKIMPNDPNYVPTLPQRSRDEYVAQPISQPVEMSDKHVVTRSLIDDGTELNSAEEDNSSKEAIFRSLTQNVKTPSAIRKIFGF